jgi:hypothetical protein
MVSSKAIFPCGTTSIFTPFCSLRIYRLECPQFSVSRLEAHPTTRSIMPRNFHRKDRQHHKPSSSDSTTQPVSGWNQTQGRNQQNWWTADVDENFPRLGQHIVSNPNTNSFSQKQRGGSTRSFPLHQRDRMLVSGGPSNYQKTKRIGLFQPNSRAVMLNSSEFKEYLLQAVEEGKRRMDEWIISEFEQASSPERDIIIWEACAMDWQPEKTIVIPQAVDIRYPWDSAEGRGKERWGRKRSGRDGMTE